MAGKPTDQFKINYFTDFSEQFAFAQFSNASLFMVLSVISVVFLIGSGIRRKALIPSRMQNVTELLYEFVSDTIKGTVGEEGRKYFPFIFTLFMFLVACNLLGLLPYAFTVTSHVAVTLAIALFVFIAITIIGFARHGVKYLSLFLPSGTPWWLAPLMIFIEFFSYLSRPISLSTRLAANMIAGHVLLKVIGGFVVGLGIVGGWLPLALLVALNGFEVFVALLQAYIFTILTCVYLNDAVHLH